MKKILLSIIFYIAFSKSLFCQFSYKELLELSVKSKDEVSTYLKVNKKGWVYDKYDKNTDSEIWKKGNEKLTLKYYSTKSRVIKYNFHNLKYNNQMSSELGATGKYSFPETIDYYAESLKIFKGPKVVVLHIICTQTDTDCKHQIDLMSNERFISEKY